MGNLEEKSSEALLSRRPSIHQCHSPMCLYCKLPKGRAAREEPIFKICSQTFRLSLSCRARPRGQFPLVTAPLSALHVHLSHQIVRKCLETLRKHTSANVKIVAHFLCEVLVSKRGKRNNVSFSNGACSVALQGSASTAPSQDDSGGRQGAPCLAGLVRSVPHFPRWLLKPDRRRLQPSPDR